MTSNLLIIDKNIKGINTFIQSINENTKFVIYNKYTDTFEDLKNNIEILSQSSFYNIAFIFENKYWSNETFLENTNFIDTMDQNNYDENRNLLNVTKEIVSNQTTDLIKNLVSTYGVNTIDFLGCSLLSDETWKKYFDFITVDSSVKVRASSDVTGNLSSGGDWVLESTGEDVSSLYFTSNIQYWNYLLGLLPTLCTNGPVYALAYDTIGNGVYVGGDFSRVDICGTNLSVNKIARYDFEDLSWSVIGFSSDASKNGIIPGTGTLVRAIYVDNSGVLYVGGVFTGVYDGSSAKTSNNIAKYDPSTKLWTALNGLSGTGVVRTIVVKESNKYIFAGGDFGSTAVGSRNFLAYYTGTIWTNMGFEYNSAAAAGKPGPVYRVSLDPSENYLYVGGTFGAKVGGGTATNYNGLLKYDVSTNTIRDITPAGGLGGGVNTAGTSGINAMKYYKDNSNNEYLYIGGNFSAVNGVTGKAPFARFNITSNKFDISFSSTGWSTVGTSVGINTIEFDLSGNPYFGGIGLLQAGGKTGNQFYRFYFDQDVSGNFKIKDGSGTFSALGGGTTGGTTPAIYNLLRTGTNFLLGGSFTTVDSNINVQNLSYYTYDNIPDTSTNFDANYGTNPGFDTLDTVQPNSMNLKKYLINNLPNTQRGKETKFQNYIKGKSVVFTDRTADISGYYLSNYGGNAYGYYIAKDVSGRDISDITLRYVIPPSGYNGNNGTYDCGDLSAAGIKYIYVPVTVPETYILKIKGISYQSFNYQPPNNTPNIGYQVPNGSSRTATLGTIMPLFNNDTSSNLWLDSVKVLAWGSNLLEYSSGTFLNCLTENTDVLTPGGFINVKQLAKGTIIITDTGKKIPIQNIQISCVKGNKKNSPFIIPKNSIDINYPSCDVTISGSHLIKYKDKWICPRKCSCFKQDTSEDFINYYHIELEDYTDNLVISGGLSVESLTHTDKPGAKIREERMKNLYFPQIKEDLKLD